MSHSTSSSARTLNPGPYSTCTARGAHLYAVGSPVSQSTSSSAWLYSYVPRRGCPCVHRAANLPGERPAAFQGEAGGMRSAAVNRFASAAPRLRQNRHSQHCSDPLQHSTTLFSALLNTPAACARLHVSSERIHTILQSEAGSLSWRTMLDRSPTAKGIAIALSHPHHRSPYCSKIPG